MREREWEESRNFKFCTANTLKLSDFFFNRNRWKQSTLTVAVRACVCVCVCSLNGPLFAIQFYFIFMQFYLTVFICFLFFVLFFSVKSYMCRDYKIIFKNKTEKKTRKKLYVVNWTRASSRLTAIQTNCTSNALKLKRKPSQAHTHTYVRTDARNAHAYKPTNTKISACTLKLAYKHVHTDSRAAENKSLSEQQTEKEVEN